MRRFNFFRATLICGDKVEIAHFATYAELNEWKKENAGHCAIDYVSIEATRSGLVDYLNLLEIRPSGE